MDEVTTSRCSVMQMSGFGRVRAVRSSRIVGYEPVELVAHDMLASIETKPVLRLTVSNILNRPVAGTLSVDLAELEVEVPATLRLAPYERREVEVRITGGQERPDNSYALALLDAGRPLKFSFRVNHDTRGSVMKLAKGRSVSKLNAQAFHVDWAEHWANEVEFAWE